MKPLRIVRSVDESMSWVHHALDRLVDHDLCVEDDVDAALSNRIISTSNAFSGIAADHTADNTIQTGVAERRNIGPGKCVRFQHVWALEKRHSCQEELLHETVRPSHVFGDIMNCMPHSVRSMAASTVDRTDLRRAMLMATPLMAMHCVACGKPCSILWTEWHTAGSPCTDFSSYGLGLELDGPTARYFWAWCALMLHMRPHIIFHENVQKFGETELAAIFGGHYIFCRILTTPNSEGWAIRRGSPDGRQIVILVLKAWLLPLLGALDVDPDILWIRDLHKLMFRRKCAYDLAAYSDSVTDEDIFNFKKWAFNRPKCRIRWQIVDELRVAVENGTLEKVRSMLVATHGEKVVNAAIKFKNDDPKSAFFVLTAAERVRLECGRACKPLAVWDVSQDPNHRQICSRERSGSFRDLPTLMAGMGLLFDLRTESLIAIEACFTAMGFAITQEHQNIAATCQFSRGQVLAANRSYRSCMRQVGNTMHVNSIGSCHLLMALLTPRAKATANRSSFASRHLKARQSSDISEPESLIGLNRWHPVLLAQDPAEERLMNSRKRTLFESRTLSVARVTRRKAGSTSFSVMYRENR